MSSETVFGFADEMRVGLRGMVRRVWGRRGVKVHQRVQMVYKWTYLFLVVDVRRGRLLWSWIDSMRSAAIAAAVDGLKHHSDMEALVWDGARGHRGEMVRSVGLATIIQPPYSPELNPAERVFQEVRRWVEGRTYGSIDEFRRLMDNLSHEELREMLERLNADIAANPDDTNTPSARGLLHMELGDERRAEEDFGRVVDLSPGDAEAHQYRGLARARLGKHRLAVGDYDNRHPHRPA